MTSVAALTGNEPVPALKSRGTGINSGLFTGAAGFAAGVVWLPCWEQAVSTANKVATAIFGSSVIFVFMVRPGPVVRRTRILPDSHVAVTQDARAEPRPLRPAS